MALLFKNGRLFSGGVSSTLQHHNIPTNRRTGVASLALPRSRIPCVFLSTSAAARPTLFPSLNSVDNDEDSQSKINNDSLNYKPDRVERILKSLGMHSSQLEAGPDFNRWKLIAAATTNHMCLGSIYAWSLFNLPLTRLHGVVAPAGSDWLLSDTTLTFSLVMGGFAWGAILGSQLDRLGPRATCLAGAACLGTGFSLAALSVQMESLPLLYLGGAVWGIANAWAYVPPVSTLIKWFPERKGFATGMCLVGYGGGGLLAAPLFGELLHRFQVAPEYVGSATTTELVNQGGKMFTEMQGKLEEVVVATTADIMTCGFQGLQEGVYLVGTGSTGVAETFACLGLMYATIMTATSFVFRLPNEEARLQIAESHSIATRAINASGAAADKLVEPVKNNNVAPQGSFGGTQPTQSSGSIDATNALAQLTPAMATRTPQFWNLYLGFGLAATGAYGFISSGKTMLLECFGSAMPDVVTVAFAASFVAMMSGANLGGRLCWSTASDYFGQKLGDPFKGRKMAYSIMWGIGAPIYLGTVWSIHECAANAALISAASSSADVSTALAVGGTAGAATAVSMIPLMVFASSVFGAISNFGGAAATRPPMIADLFGVHNVSVISARQLSVVLPSAYLGPKVASYFREDSIRENIIDLTSKVDAKQFELAFGAGKDHLGSLIEHKTVTIPRLMEIVPHGTIDPTPFMYDKALYAMAAMQVAALLSNIVLKPVSPEQIRKLSEGIKK